MPRGSSGHSFHTRLFDEGTEWTARSLKGAYPPLSSQNQIVEDERSKRVFFYGGIAPGDEDNNPTADFHVCDTQTMTVRNITNSLRFWDSKSPFPEDKMPRRRLPALGDPGSTLLRLENRTLMFLFGGYNGDEDHPSSDLIAIDIDRLIWWVVQVAGKVEGGNIAARIDPAMTAIGNKIYIFAGITAYDDNPEHLNSYSVAEYDLESRSWRWELADIPYTDVVPPNHIFGDCIPVYDGKKILLTPGRRKATDRFRFSQDTVFYFCIKHKVFQTAYASGHFPSEVFWYYVRGFDNFEVFATPDTNSLRSLRSSTSHHPYRSSRNSSSTSSSTNSQLTAPSVLICAWVRWLNTKYLVPELWRFYLFPDDHITCFNIGKNTWEFDLNLLYFMVVGERAILMGGDPSPDGNGNSVSETGDNDNKSDTENSGAVCSTYVDIPVRQLVLSSRPQR